VADHLEFSSDSHRWNFNFILATHDWEVDLFTSFFTLSYFKVRLGVKTSFVGSLPRESCSMSDCSTML
jgi:hypothetical protein